MKNFKRWLITVLAVMLCFGLIPIMTTAGAEESPPLTEELAPSGEEVSLTATVVDPATDPGDDPATDPGEDPAADDPGDDPATDPGEDPATDPGDDPAADDPGEDPATDPGDDPATDPGEDPAADDPGNVSSFDITEYVKLSSNFYILQDGAWVDSGYEDITLYPWEGDIKFQKVAYFWQLDKEVTETTGDSFFTFRLPEFVWSKSTEQAMRFVNSDNAPIGKIELIDRENAKALFAYSNSREDLNEGFIELDLAKFKIIELGSGELLSDLLGGVLQNILPLGGVILYPSGDPLDAPRYGTISLVAFKAIANGCMGGMALDHTGNVWTFGYNLFGQLGVGLTEPQQRYYGGMKRIPYFSNNGITVVEIGASYETRYALGSNGLVYAWGHGANGAMGTGTTPYALTNTLPQVVPGLTNVVHIYVSDSYLGEASVIAQTADGSLYGWGNNRRSLLGLGTSTTGTTVINTPTLITLPPELAARGIVHITLGCTSSFILDDQGDLWSAGSDEYGEQGNGPGDTRNATFTKFNRTAYGIGPIVDVDVSYARLQITGDRIVCCDATDAWEWGATFGDGGAVLTRVDKQSPTKVIVSAAEIAAYGYTPVPKAVTTSEHVGYFIDQYGRPWAWGTGYYFGFGRDGGYAAAGGSNTQLIPSTAAMQYPKVVGDGDTQDYNSTGKYPLYYDVPSDWPAGTKRLPQGDAIPYRAYGFNMLHPTIYDEKYMLKDADGNVLSVDGVPLRYATTTAGGLTVGLYYESTGGTANTIITPAKTGTPAIDPTEWLWIRLAFQPTPFISQLDVTLSAYAFIDPDGNLFKWGNDGSGAIGWGWDYQSQYDPEPSTQSGWGLFNRYTYEVMYMRGAPTVDMVSILANIDKKVYTTAGTPATNPVNISVRMPRSNYNEALESDIYSDLNQLKYVLIPYDPTDPNFNADLSTLTEADFMTMYNAADPSMRGELLTSVLHSGSAVQTLNFEVNAPVNGRIIVFGDNERYASTDGGVNRELSRFDPAFASITIDNVYTDTGMKHKGEGDDPNGDTVEVYAATNDTVQKDNDDSADTKEPWDRSLYGLPLDANGDVIPSPTYGYDTVTIRSYEDAGYPAGSTILNYWQWKEYIGTTLQDETVSFTLNDNSYSSGYTHTFYYEPNSNWTHPSGTKIWEDMSNQYNLRPASITLTLKQYERNTTTGAKGAFIDDVETITVIEPVTPGDTWPFSFKWYKSYEYTYEVVETAITWYADPPDIVYTNLVIGPNSPEDFTDITVTNTLNLKPILFFKIDQQGTAITSDFARFVLTNATPGGKVLDTTGTEQDSVTLITDTATGRLVMPLQLPGTYLLTETKAPAGYNLLTKVIVVVIASNGTITATLGDEPGDLPLDEAVLTGTDATTYAKGFNIINKGAAELPQTSGGGVFVLVFSEAVLLSATGLLLLSRRKRVATRT